MNTRVAIAAALFLGIALAGAGCGSGGASKPEAGGSSCLPAASGKGTMSWLQDGTPECADSAVATFQNTPLYTTFSLTGATTTIGIRIGVSTVLGPGPIGGSYSCAPLDSVSVTFFYGPGQPSASPRSCQLTLNMQGTAGVHATGTFSATFVPAADGTTAITSGVFDAPVTIVGGS